MEMLTFGEHFLFTGKTILVTPLDWGLGHSTRCVPLIRQLAAKNKVIIGSTAVNEELLRNYFPDIPQVPVPPCRVRYSRYLPGWLSVLLQLPRLLRLIGLEKRWLSDFIIRHKPDVVISDNRFGMFHPAVESVFITHQLRILSPVGSQLATRLNLRLIRNFNQVWVPDLPQAHQRLAGCLSSVPAWSDLAVKYIGPLSALAPTQKSQGLCSDCLMLLSGPEPQRSILEQRLVKLMESSEKKYVLVRGRSGLPKLVVPDHIRVFDLCTGPALSGLIAGADLVICRSGYSTLMDLHLFGCRKMLLVPTPGQPEQEYLALHWEKCFGARICGQEALGAAFA